MHCLKFSISTRITLEIHFERCFITQWDRCRILNKVSHSGYKKDVTLKLSIKNKAVVKLKNEKVMVTAARDSLSNVPLKFTYYLRRLVTDCNNICCREN